ncbi:MAG: Cytidine deaminase [Fibrobacteres bacterium]|nr:Cytidine deaminase [Fibrobacterota bacterium]
MSISDSQKPELVIAFVAPVGVDLEWIESLVKDFLKQFAYASEKISISSLIKNIAGIETVLVEEPAAARINSYMTAGNEARSNAGRGDILAALAITEIMRKRTDYQPLHGRVQLLHSLKHPEEVRLLREVYQHGFFLIGISSSKEKRLEYLRSRKGIPKDEAEALIARDESEDDKHGQHTRETFHLSDAFVNIDSSDLSDRLGRIFKLLFGFPYSTPTVEEYAMFMAFSASLRSADLSRQVGAVVMSPHGDCLSTGANDVPCFPGGLYWESSNKADHRDHVLGYDSNESMRTEIMVRILRKFFPDLSEADLLEKGEKELKDTGIFDITEYGRAVHAEMEALLSCARTGVSTRGAILYSTTFPCHNCAKHIVAAGISRVVFIEPYPKSQALRLHEDSIIFIENQSNQGQNTKVTFEPFVGIGPRRYIDLFSLHLSGGSALQRKSKGRVVKWQQKTAKVRFPMLPSTYLDNEILQTRELNEEAEGKNGNQ